jgi:putative FmdB family regulatory protein
MPVYEYFCKKCNENFEVWRSASKNGSQRCPTCKCKAEKVFHAPGIIFKGSGFHVNDYGSKGSHSTSAAPAACPKAAEKTCAGCEASK